MDKLAKITGGWQLDTVDSLEDAERVFTTWRKYTFQLVQRIFADQSEATHFTMSLVTWADHLTPPRSPIPHIWQPLT